MALGHAANAATSVAPDPPNMASPNSGKQILHSVQDDKAFGGSAAGGSHCIYATLDSPNIFSLHRQEPLPAWLALGHLVVAMHALRAAWIRG